jgi:membrane-bound ClpP family serine protease
MTALFIILTIFGVVEVASTMVIFTFMRRHDHENPPFQMMAQAVGFVAAGVGGLAMTWADIGTLGFSVVTIISWVVFMVVVYKLVLPDVRRRREARIRTGYVGLGGTVTRAVPVGDSGEVSFKDRDGNRLRLPARSNDPTVLAASTRVRITGVDDEFIHVASATEL